MLPFFTKPLSVSLIPSLKYPVVRSTYYRDVALCGVGNGLHPPVLWWTLARHWPVSLQSQWEDGTRGEETQSLGLYQPLVPFILALQSPVVLELRRKWVWWSWAHGHVCRPREGHRKSQEAPAWGKDPSVSVLITKWWNCSGKSSSPWVWYQEK